MKLRFSVYRHEKLLSTPSFDHKIIKIGRLSSAHLRLDDEKVARIHAVIEVDPDGQVQLIDMGSPQGVWLNGTRIQKQPIHAGDEIAMGDTKLLFQPEERKGAEAVSDPAEPGPLPFPPVLPETGQEITRELPPFAKRPSPRRDLSRIAGACAPGWVASPGRDELLEVKQLWWEDVLDVRTLSGERARVVIGEDQGADFFVPGELLPARSFPIARREGDHLLLSLTRKSKGELRYADGTVRRLADLLAEQRAEPDPEFAGRQVLALPCGAVATVAFGNVGFCFRTVPRASGFVSRWRETLDTNYINSLMFAVFMLVAGISTLILRTPAPSLVEADMLKMPDRFVQFFVRRALPAPPPVRVLSSPSQPAENRIAESAPRHHEKEGRAGLVGMPDTGRRSAVQAVDPDDRQPLATAGLLPFLGIGKPLGQSLLADGTGLGGEMRGAIGNLIGKDPGNSGGIGGLGLKGTGPGGGGVAQTLGTGPIGPRHGGRIPKGGVSQIRHRPETTINITATDPIIQGSLSMELIRRVVHDHHSELSYCYSKELTRAPSLRGKIVINWTIDASGFVSQARVQSTTLQNGSMEQCLVGKVRTWRFPEPRGGGVVIVNYPFIFSANG